MVHAPDVSAREREEGANVNSDDKVRNESQVDIAVGSWQYTSNVTKSTQLT
jgi:hypothetical protein